MGNWRRANLIGTCDAGEVSALRRFVKIGNGPDETYENFGPLSSTAGIAGLPLWPAEDFNVVGNLAERGYGEESIAEQLEKLAEIAPSLRCVVHLGGDNETSTCVATIALTEEGAEVLDPQVEELGDIPEGQMQSNLMSALMGGRR